MRKAIKAIDRDQFPGKSAMLCFTWHRRQGEGCWRVTVGLNHSRSDRRLSGFAVVVASVCSIRLGTSHRKARRAERCSPFSPRKTGRSVESGSSTCCGATGRRSRPARVFAHFLPICASSGAPTSPPSSSPKGSRWPSLRRFGMSCPNPPLTVAVASCSKALIISTPSSTNGFAWNAGKRPWSVNRLQQRTRLLPARAAWLPRVIGCTDSLGNE